MNIMTATIGTMPRRCAYGFSGKSVYHFSIIDSIPAALRMAIGMMIEMATSGLRPDRIIEKITRRLTMVLRDMNILPAEARMPIMTSATVARPNRGAKYTLLYARLKLKNGAKAFVIFAMKPLKLRLLAKMRFWSVDGFKMQLITSGVMARMKMRTQRIN